MDRNREARRATMAAANGLPRRRQRSSGLRDSPEEDGAMELVETSRLRDRKKDRDRDRDRERERDRERDRISRSKRRRGLGVVGGGGGGGGDRDESSEESVNDEEDDEDEDAGGTMRMVPASAAAVSMSPMMNHHGHHHNNHHNHHHHPQQQQQQHHSHNNHHGGGSNLNNHSHNNNVGSHHHQLQQLHHQRKSYPPPSKNFRAPQTAALKAADEMIGVSVPRKARSASTKRSNEWTSSAVGMVASDQIHRQASTSPVRPPATVAGQASTPLAPVSPPSSSNASVRKKLKPNNGPKLRQPKPPPLPPSSKSSSSGQDEIEIEIAEVLYGMNRQPQGPSKQEIASNDPKEVNKSSTEAKSRVSSPISSSPYGAPQLLPSRSSSHPIAGAESSAPAWSFTVAVPKRKKPRLVKYDGKYEDSKPSYIPTNPISSAAKVPTDQFAKTESSSANLEKPTGSTPENGGIAADTAQSRPLPPPSLEPHQPESIKLETSLVSDPKPSADKSESRDLGSSKEELDSPKKEPAGQRLDDKREIATSMKLNSTTSEIESQREEKFQIDLMAPPPSRSSPERDVEIDYVPTEAKPMAIDTETEIKPVVKEDTKALKLGGGEQQPQQQQQEAEQPLNAEPEKAKSGVVVPTVVVEDPEPKKLPGVKERNIDLHLDLDHHSDVARDSSSSANKPHHHHHHPHQQQHQHHNSHVLPRQYQQPHPPTTMVNDKSAQSGPTLPLPLPTMPMPTWPGGLSPMGYMTPLQGVVTMDGSAVSSAAIQPPPHMPYIFNQPRSKRCATHCYIARSIHLHQQIARMNPYWPAAAGSGPVYGAKPCNLNIMPNPVDLHGNMPAVHRGVNQVQDKVPGLAMFPGHNGKDKASPAVAAGVVDSGQRKQILLQPSLPPGAPSNLVQGPIIFPLSQQQAVAAAAAASVRPPGAVKSPAGPGNATVPNGANPTASAAGAQAMTFNYPNMAGNEQPQYLAINAYSFPIPTHVGAPPAYRGAHPPAMPFFNGSFYSTFHPSQLPQQQQLSLSQQQAQQHGHQNPSMSSGSSSSQKHLQSQQQQQQRQTQHVNNAMNGAGGGGSLHGFPASKNPSAQAQQQIQMQQQRQHQSQQHITHQARQLESEMGNEESPSTADSRMTRQTMSMYSANYGMPMHAPNFAMMTPASLAAAGVPSSGSGGNSEKKHQQQQGSKGGSIEPQAFAVSFASMNGGPTAPPGLDIASLAQQQAMFTDMRQGYQQYMPVAAVPTAEKGWAVGGLKKNYRGPDDGKTGGDTSNADEERKAAMKSSSGLPHSIAFSRPDLSDASGSAMPGTTVVDSSARNLNLASAQQRSSGSVALPPGMTNLNATSAQQQRNLQHQQQQQQQQQLQQQQQQQLQQQQMIQLQKQQHQQLAAVSRTKTPPTSNGSIYSDHLPSSMAAKFPNALSTYPQSLVHGTTTSPAQSPQWKSSARSSASQVPSPSMTASSNPSSLKSLSQHQGRSQQSHTQISFAAAGNQKPSVVVQSQVPASSNQSPSPPIMVGSPTTSSVSKSAGGSPRTNTTSTSTGNKGPQASSLSSQQSKNSQPVSTMKSSPVVPGKNINSPSILGNPHISSSVNTAGSGAKSQLPQQQPLSKQSVQQAQLYFSPSYLPTQAPHSNSPSAASAAAAAAAASGPYYSQRRRSDQPQQQLQGVVAGPGSSGMLSLSPSVTMPNTGTSDSSKNKGGGGLPTQTFMPSAQYTAAVQSGNVHQIFPYVHSVPAAVQMKPTEQKQPAGE